MRRKSTLRDAVPIGMGDKGWLHGEEALMRRVERVLSTPLGTLPWRPEYGCGIWSILGQSASAQHLAAARWHIEAALTRWIPDVSVVQCEITVSPDDARLTPAALQAAGASPLERGLLHLGVEAALQIDLTLNTHRGPVQARLELSA